MVGFVGCVGFRVRPRGGGVDRSVVCCQLEGKEKEMGTSRLLDVVARGVQSRGKGIDDELRAEIFEMAEELEGESQAVPEDLTELNALWK